MTKVKRGEDWRELTIVVAQDENEDGLESEQAEEIP
jgi:hypothetical protein